MTDNPSIVAVFENIDVYGRNPPSAKGPKILVIHTWCAKKLYVWLSNRYVPYFQYITFIRNLIFQ